MRKTAAGLGLGLEKPSSVWSVLTKQPGLEAIGVWVAFSVMRQDELTRE